MVLNDAAHTSLPGPHAEYERLCMCGFPVRVLLPARRGLTFRRRCPRCGHYVQFKTGWAYRHAMAVGLWVVGVVLGALAWVCYRLL